MHSKIKAYISKHNFLSMIIEGGFYLTGYTFFDVYVVLPVFTYALTGDLKLAGLAAALKQCSFILPQLVMGHYTPRIRNLPLFLGIIGFAGRSSFFAIPLLLLTNASPLVKVGAAYITMVIASFADGLINVPWIDVLGRTIPAKMRGSLLGFQQFAGGIGGLAAGYIIKYFLSGSGSPDLKYSRIFFIGAVLVSASGALLFTLKDRERTIREDPIGIAGYLKGLYGHIRDNRNYGMLILTQSIASMGGLAAPLYILFSAEHFRLAENAVTTLMVVQIAGSLSGGIIWGNLGKYRRSRFIIKASLFLNLLTALTAIALALIKIPVSIVFLAAMVFCAGILMSSWIGYVNYLLDIVPESKRPVYTAITNTIMFPFTFTSLLGGIIADAAGFIAVFALVVMFIASALIVSAKLE
jgi:MFS family permease